MKRVNIKFTARNISKVHSTLIGGSPPNGIKIHIEQADPEPILEQMFEQIGKEELIEFLNS